MGRLRSQVLLFLVPLFCTICSYGSNTWSAGARGIKMRCKGAERQALLDVKRDLQFWNGTDLLSSWGNEEGETDCCNWLGIKCAEESDHVVRLDLSSITALGISDYVMSWNVGGKISPSLFELRYLSYLDLSFIEFDIGSVIPSPIGNLSQLRYLNLSYTFMGGKIPPQLANLSNLQVLDLGYNHFTVDSLKWVSHLSSLVDLRLNDIDLSRAYDWVQIVYQLPSLTNLQLGYCNLSEIIIPPSLSFVNSSTSLSILNLSNNKFSVPIYSWLFNFNKTLVHLDLSVNQLEGSVPESFGMMTALTYLDLSHNDKLSGSIPKCFSQMTALTYLDLSHNKLKGFIPEIFRNMSALAYLDLGDNMLEGEIPKSIWNLTMLRALRMASNNLIGDLPQTCFQQLKHLEILDISRNSLGGVISEAGFSELSELYYLDLSFNSLALNIPSEWIPPFHLSYIYLGSCKLGPQFPKWLRTQKNYSFLDISNSGISDSIPNWFWNLSTGFRSMNLSNNQITGEIGDVSLDLHEEVLYDNLDIDLSSNQLDGPVPSFLFKVAALDLSWNRFSKLNFPSSDMGHAVLKFLDVSYNELQGELPDCWSRFKRLKVLTLTKNK